MSERTTLSYRDTVFNNYILTIVLSVLLISAAVKLYTHNGVPEVSDWNFHQLQKIEQTKEPFSFAVFGDNKNAGEPFDALIAKLNADDEIAFALDVGDIVYDGDTEKFHSFLRQISRLHKPLLTAFGNHEARDGGRALYYEIFGKFYYTFSIAESYFIVLDDANKRDLNDAQMHWLREKLRESQKYKYRFVFMHVPLFDPREGAYKKGHSLKDLTFAKTLNSLFDRHEITMLFVSHIHGYFRGVWGKTPYIITGGAGAALAGSDPEHYFYHYIKVGVDETGVTYDVVKLKTSSYEQVGHKIDHAWRYLYTLVSYNLTDILLTLTSLYLLLYILFVRRGLSLHTIDRDNDDLESTPSSPIKPST